MSTTSPLARDALAHSDTSDDAHAIQRVWHPRWRYDEALDFLDDAWRKVSAGGPMVVATGVHDPAVVTLGRHTSEAQILDEAWLARAGVSVVRTERGGGATWHGPGQVVVYPVVSMNRLALSLPELTRRLAEAARATLAHFGVVSAIADDGAGVVVDGAKIASIGLRARRRVITHGLSLNVDHDLRFFDAIAPCGMPGRRMTTMARVGATGLDVRDVADRLACEVIGALVLGSTWGS